jgi:hypothetical protein
MVNLNLIPSEECVSALTSLFNEFEKNIQNLKYVFPQNLSDALMNMIATGSNGSIFKEDYSLITNNELLISNGKDIIVAIKNITSEPFICKIFVEEKEIHNLTIYINEIEWILNGIPLSIISLQCEEIRLKFYNLMNEPITSAKFSLYYGCLENIYRFALVQYSIIGYLDDEHYFINTRGEGTCNIYTITPNINPIVEHDNLKPFMELRARPSIVENYRKENTHKQVEKIKKELMEKAWHPSRYTEWCWNEDEKAELRKDCNDE